MPVLKQRIIVGEYHAKMVNVPSQEERKKKDLLTGDDEYEDNINAARHCPVNIIKVGKVS